MLFGEIFLYFLISVLPCISWLLFYLRQDVHPESKGKIIEVFLWGVIVVTPALVIEQVFSTILPQELLNTSPFWFAFYYIIGVGLVEESLKYLVVKLRVLDSSHFDEPIDTMLYLIIAGLGFATVENIIVIFDIKSLEEAAIVSMIRLLTAVFLHTFSAAITGYFLALSIYEKNRAIGILGLSLAALSHGLYNISIVKLETARTYFSFLLPTIIIILMGIFIFVLFLKVKKLPRTCKI